MTRAGSAREAARVRANSSPPPSASVRAARAAVEAASAAARAEQAAADAYAEAGREEHEEYVPTSVAPVNYPPEANALGQRWFFARDYPDLADGIYTCVALRNRGLNPNVLAATGLLQGWKTEPPVLRKGQSTGVQSTTIYWW